VLHDEAYPDLGEPVMEFISRYLDSKDTVLILIGTPGSGKTRFVRKVFGEISFACSFPPGTKAASVASIYRACGTLSN